MVNTKERMVPPAQVGQVDNDDINKIVREDTVSNGNDNVAANDKVNEVNATYNNITNDNIDKEALQLCGIEDVH